MIGTIAAWLASAAGGWALGKGLDAASNKGHSYLSNLTTVGTSFLNHDPRHCNQAYAEVGPKLDATLPYLELADFSAAIRANQPVRISAQVDPKEFYTQATDMVWAQARARAYLDYREAGHAKTDSQVMRVSGAQVEGGQLALSVSPTRYFCQAESNLVLDQKVRVVSRQGAAMETCLRDLLANRYDGRLPALNDPRMANSLGVAICFLSRDARGNITLRMVNRTKRVGVFPAGVHPAMSCAIKWPESDPGAGERDLMELIAADIETEMRQETGLTPDQYSKPVPLSFCREFLRGGKPQLFCLSYTDLPPQALNEARDAQMRINQKERPEKVELLGSSLVSSNDPSVALGAKLPQGLTHEGAACLYLVTRLLSQVEG